MAKKSLIETTCFPLRLRIADVWHNLPFVMQMQRQTYWCWAAVATSVSLFYDSASNWTQCLVANGELGRTDCCQSGGANPRCNDTGIYVSSLQLVGHFDHEVNSPVTFAEIQGEVDASRPLCAGIVWSGGMGHFVAIVGYFVPGEWIEVKDPDGTITRMPYATFQTSYQGSGTWTDSYFTQP